MLAVVPCPLQLFSRSALALAGSPGSMQSPPDSPLDSPLALASGGGGEVAGWRALPPRVPRLQLSTVSLQQLQEQLSQQQPQGQEEDEAAASAAVASQQPFAAPAPPLPAAADMPPPVQRGPGMWEHILLTGDPTDPASPRLSAEAGATPAAAGMQQGKGPPALAMPALLRSVSPAQQELLAAAQQWQLSARSAVQDSIPAYRPQQMGQPPLGSARGTTPRPGAAAGSNTARSMRHQTPRAGGSAAATPRGKKQLLQQRPTYGQDTAFLELKQAYHAGECSSGNSACSIYRCSSWRTIGEGAS